MRKYNPEIHHRRSVRLRGYDYSEAGAYFITICTQAKQCIFGEIQHNEMFLNEYGQVAYNHWEDLPKRWNHIELGAFQVMPNHLHGILVFHPVDQAIDLSEPKMQWAKKPVLGQVVGAYCSTVSKACVKLFEDKHPGEFMGKIWQRGFHEHIIRNVKSFDQISIYIIHNPENWEKDKFFL